MRRLILGSCLSFFLTSTGFAESEFPEPIRELVTRVCGYCHYPDFFDDESGELVEQLFLARKEIILDRLQRAPGSVGRMPPKRSPIGLTDAERLILISYLKGMALAN